MFTPTRQLLLVIKRKWQLDRIHGLPAVRYPTDLWARPVIRYRPVTGTDRITTSPARAGTGEPLHRLESVPVRWFTGYRFTGPAVVSPSFCPSVYKEDKCWWGTRDLITVYLWDSMEDQDRQRSPEALLNEDNWVVWKTKDNKWTHDLQ